MDFKVIYTEPALAELADIVERSWQQHPATTERFFTSLLNHVDSLKSFPNLGAPVEEHPNVRCLLHSPLKVFYRVNKERKLVEVLHFWHGAREDPEL